MNEEMVMTNIDYVKVIDNAKAASNLDADESLIWLLT